MSADAMKCTLQIFNDDGEIIDEAKLQLRFCSSEHPQAFEIEIPGMESDEEVSGLMAQMGYDYHHASILINSKPLYRQLKKFYEKEENRRS